MNATYSALHKKLAMGCEQLGGTDWGVVDIERVRRAVAHAYDSGIRIFDTADVYGLGRSEQELARALGGRRHDALIITKGGVRWLPDPKGGRARTYRDSSPTYLTSALEASLRRLRLEAIPLYLVHWPDPEIPQEMALEALERARLAGKIIAYGLSNVTADGLALAAGRFPIAAVQMPYNLIDRESGSSVFGVARGKGVSAVAYGALAQGLLAGKYTGEEHFGTDDRRHRLAHFAKDRWDAYRPLFRAVNEIAQGHALARAAVAIRWVLDDPLVDCAVVGAKSEEQVDGMLTAMTLKLTSDEHQQLSGAANARAAV